MASTPANYFARAAVGAGVYGAGNFVERALLPKNTAQPGKAPATLAASRQTKDTLYDYFSCVGCHPTTSTNSLCIYSRPGKFVITLYHHPANQASLPQYRTPPATLLTLKYRLGKSSMRPRP